MHIILSAFSIYKLDFVLNKNSLHLVRLNAIKFIYFAFASKLEAIFLHSYAYHMDAFRETFHFPKQYGQPIRHDLVSFNLRTISFLEMNFFDGSMLNEIDQ